MACEAGEVAVPAEDYRSTRNRLTYEYEEVLSKLVQFHEFGRAVQWQVFSGGGVVMVQRPVLLCISDFGSESKGLLLVFSVCVPKQRGLARDTAALCCC